jgi:hypothetical protein
MMFFGSKSGPEQTEEAMRGVVFTGERGLELMQFPDPVPEAIIQADCARFSVERGVDVDRLFTHRWSIDQADEAYKLFDRQVDGKGVFLM